MFSTPQRPTERHSRFIISVVMHATLIVFLLRPGAIPKRFSLIPVVHAAHGGNEPVWLSATTMQPKPETEAKTAPAPARISGTRENKDLSEPRPGILLEPGQLLTRVIPVYPSLAKAARVEGPVVLEATIDETGTIEEVKVVSGHPLLIAAAVDAVKQWLYEPARIGGRPTHSSVTVTIHFTLRYEQSSPSIDF